MSWRRPDLILVLLVSIPVLLSVGVLARASGRAAAEGEFQAAVMKAEQRVAEASGRAEAARVELIQMQAFADSLSGLVAATSRATMAARRVESAREQRVRDELARTRTRVRALSDDSLSILARLELARRYGVGSER